MGIAQIFRETVSFRLVCSFAPAAQKSGQNIAVLPGWGERTYLGDCYSVTAAVIRWLWNGLDDREVDFYLCTHQNRRPDECPKTHIIYHEVLYPYVLEQIRALARSMKRRKVNSPIRNYADQDELTSECLKAVVERVEVGHVTYKAKPGKVLQIRWRFL